MRNLLNIVFQAFKKRNRVKFKCFAIGCTQKAIYSHSQSFSNALKRIAEKGHVVKVSLPFLTDKIVSVDSCFKMEGIGKASTFLGFCGKHDDEYFKHVDVLNKNNITKEALARLSFRTFSYEERTKERVLFLLKDLIANKNFFGNKVYLKATSIGIENHLNVTRPHYLNKFINMFESKDYKNMNAIVFVLDKTIPISCSSVVDPTMLRSDNLTEPALDVPLDAVFFNLIPQDDTTLVIFSFFPEQKEKLRDFMHHFMKLENIIFNHCEEVLLNPVFYASLDSKVKTRIITALKPWSSWEKEEIPDLFNVKLGTPIYI